MKTGKGKENAGGEQPVRMRKSLKDYDAVIFDVDGTLYFQRPMRLKMAWKLGTFYLLHPWRFRELLAVKTFREIRENWKEEERDQTEENPTEKNQIEGNRTEACQAGNRAGDGALDWRQYIATGKKIGLPPRKVKETVERWMYQVPLDLLPGCQDRMVSGLMEKLRRRGTAVLVYSDYPAEDKLKAMGIRADRVFCALDPDMMCLKPDPKGMSHILSAVGFQPDQVLMVGDRYSRDGLSARNVGADWLILPPAPGRRKKLLKEIMDEN